MHFSVKIYSVSYFFWYFIANKIESFIFLFTFKLKVD